MDDTITILEEEIKSCSKCLENLPFGPRPIIQISKSAKILIIGQAPGTKVHKTGIPWDDNSGDRLREWMAINKSTFYNKNLIALMPMGFCYPGRLKKGGDAPPRPECAPLWHERILTELPNIEIVLLIGQYAQKYYLKKQYKKTLTETVQAWQEYQPRNFIMPHPSWRSTIWLKKNPWFEEEVLPALRTKITAIL